MEGSLLLWCLSPGSEWPGGTVFFPDLHSQGGVAFPAKNQTCVVLFSWRNLISTWYQPVIFICRRCFFLQNEQPCLFLPWNSLLPSVRRHLFKERHLLKTSGVLPSPSGWQELVGDPRILLRGRGSCCLSSFTVLEMLQLHPWKLTWNPQNWELEPMLFLFQMEHFQCPC